MKLKVIPKFTGKNYKNIEEIINDSNAKKLLWAEILFNDNIDWDIYKDLIPEEYKKACVFYTNFKYLFQNRKPLPTVKEKIDNREIRRFEEILRIM